MTLVEQRKKLIEAMESGTRGKIHIISGFCATDNEIVDSQLAAISAAGFAIVGPEVTKEIIEIARELIETSVSGFRTDDLFKAMLAAGDLARKPE